MLSINCRSFVGGVGAAAGVTILHGEGRAATQVVTAGGAFTLTRPRTVLYVATVRTLRRVLSVRSVTTTTKVRRGNLPRNATMLAVGDKEHPTVTDAAKQLGVSAKTINGYIKKGIIPAPPQIEHGLRMVNIYPPKYLEEVKKTLNEYRQSKKKQ